MKLDANKTESRWEHFHHGADIGVRAFGPTKAAAFVQSAMALTAVITQPSMVHPREVVNVAFTAPDDEPLLVDWLNALIFEMAIRKMLFGSFEVSLSAGRLEAKVWGKTGDLPRRSARCLPCRSHPAPEISTS
ncbi:MAG: archease [Verrucomicrobia bacterium]|nr:archease [Verrucomicrobiota bacterium]